MKMHKRLFIFLTCFFLLLLSFGRDNSLAICSSDPVLVKIAGSPFPFTSIQEAYNSASETSSEFTLLLAGEIFTENLTLNGGAVILDGGYDSSFASKTSPSSVLGTITISTGSLIVAAGTDNPKIISTSTPQCAFDRDGDSYTLPGSCTGSKDDCNDNDASIHPGAVEIPYDGIDQDCSGADLTFVDNGNACVGCHDPDNALDASHSYRPTAPDSSCVACHAGPVSSILSGHYDRTVRTTDNGVAAGTTIDCWSCHDDGNHTGGFPLGDGNGEVWNEVSPPYPNNYTCDNCHADRVAQHATQTAHDKRPIDSSCAECHTSDTAELGSPGSGTLESQADVDTLHRSDCTLCHAYTGTTVDAGTVRQMIQQGLDGSPVSCLDCHAEHHGLETNQVFYDPIVDTSQPAEEGCALCHIDYDLENGTSLGLSTWETILVEHDLDGTKDGSSNTCANCHAYDGNSSAPLADVQSAIANGCATCASCHTDKTPDIPHGLPTTGKHTLHIDLPGINGCSGCHANPPYFKSGTDTNSDGLYDLAETDVCNPCHQDWDSGLPVEQDYKTGWYTVGFTLECNDCHAEVVDNGDNIPVGGRREVAGEFPVAVSHAHYGAFLDSASCKVCHDHNNFADHSDGTVYLLDPDGGAGYGFVSPSDLASDPDVSNFCANCHDADGATRLTSPQDPTDPFANGNVPPDVATRFMGTLQWSEWYGDSCFGSEGSGRPVNSHHDISDADQAFSGAKIECLDCHGAHTSADSQKLIDPFTKNIFPSNNVNEFCLSCHKGEHDPVDPIFPPEVAVPAFYSPPPENIPGEYCGPGMVYDCAGTCVEETGLNAVLGDGSCDAITELNLDCNIFNFDNGDCRPFNTPNNNCGIGMVYDCADNCVAQTDVDTALADGACNEAIDFDLNCSEFNYDNLSCRACVTDPGGFENCNYLSACVGNDCSSLGGIDSCSYYLAPWWIQVTWTDEAHGDGSKRQWGGYSGAPAVDAMDCIACHDSHGSYDAISNPAGNPYMLRDNVDGTQFVDDGVRPNAQWTGPPWETTGTAGTVIIKDFTSVTIGPQLGDQLCVKCHASWQAAYSWHSYCGGCLSCHSHGMAWGASDFGSQGLDDTPYCQ